MNQERFFCEGRVCLWSIHTVEAEETVKFVVIKLAGIGKKRGKSDQRRSTSKLSASY